MGSVPRPDKIDVYIDDAAVARGEVNHRSVRVEIEWREAEEVTPIVAARAEWPPPVKADLVPLECADGRMELFPKSPLEKWRRVGVRDGSNFTSFYDMARRSPEGMREPGLTEAIEYASELIRQYLPGFDAYSPEGAEFLARIIDRID